MTKEITITPRQIAKCIDDLLNENEDLKASKDNKDKWFELIRDLGFDYDGYNDIDNLKGLIDELVHYAVCGIANYDYEMMMNRDEDNE